MESESKLAVEHQQACEKMKSQAEGASRVTVPLAVPIQCDGVETSELVLRRPTAGDILAAQKSKGGEAEQVFFLLQRLGSVPPGAIEQIDLADFDLVQAALEGFLGARVAEV